MKPSRWHLAFGFAVVLGTAMACGSSDNNSGFGDGDKDGGTVSGGDDGGVTLGNGEGGIGFGGGSFNASTFALTPATTTLDLTQGADAGAAGTVQFKATDNGAPVPGALFDIADRGELGSIGPSTGLFAASGSLGGAVTVEAKYMGATATATIAIVMHQTQNGASDALTAAPPNNETSVNAFGPGGYGGVGGDGSGGAVTGTQQTALDAASSADAGGGDGAGWLYPYDNTMFPRGILAPLLQWSIGSSGDYQAVKVTLSEPGFQYTGYFAKPFLAKTFGDIPIPAAVWTSVYSSYTSATAKEDLQITVALLPASGASAGAAFSLPTRTVHIAGGSLRGKIYYQSYNTQLATSDVQDINHNYFGGATLAISPGASAPDPTPAAGDDNPGHSSASCRVCHSVALSGSALVTQDGTNYNNSIFYDLGATTNAPIASPTGSPFPGVTPDGTTILTSTLPVKGHTTPPASSSFFSVPSGTAVPFGNLPANLQAFLPAFSADGTKVAYTDGSGGPESGGALTVSPVDLVGKTLGTPVALYTPAKGANAYWPSFMPASDGVVFENELVSNGRDYAGTRPNGDSGSSLLIGPHGELWYANLATGKATRLDNANGDGYLPPHPSAVAADVNNDPVFNYEPTVNPVVSGGYAWIVFTSRRLYGNVATISPFASDPRNVDLSQTPTPKKLWVAAIDLSSDGTADKSFPAFYLPGQEILAGNGRAFWVVEPCQGDGTSCATGDQCCGGYCQPSGDGGALVCSDVKPTCSAEYDKCTTAADCCDSSLQCIGGRCSVSAPR